MMPFVKAADRLQSKHYAEPTALIFIQSTDYEWSTTANW